VRRTINVTPQGPFAPPRPPTVEERMAARDRLFEARYPRLGPPQKPFIHIPGLPKPEPRPALTIKEAMGTVPIARSGRIAIMARSTNKGMSRTTAPPRPAQ
jgi:hypothetical protein